MSIKQLTTNFFRKPNLLISFYLLAFSLQAQISYVDQDASGSNDGSSWVDAYTDLQDALTIAQANDTIWVAAGTYKPTTGTSRGISFVIPDSVKVFGGFSGTETPSFDLNLRNFETNETILSGDIGIQGNDIDNSFHVVRTNYVSPATLLNGFTIAYGNADDGNITIPDVLGGGFFNNADGTGNSSNPTVKNCIFRDNYAISGGGFYNFGNGGVAKSTIINCKFIDNSARSGGGILNNARIGGEATATVLNSVFYNNTAEWDGGGVMNFSRGSSPNHSKYINCTFYNNTADLNGDDIFNEEKENGNTDIEVVNTIIVNTTSGAIPIVNDGNINFSISYSLAKGNSCTDLGTTISCGAGMVYDASFSFVDELNADFRIPFNSKAIKSGNNSYVNTDIDLRGNPRIVDGVVDIGAYEYKSDVYTYVNKDATGANDGSSWEDAFTDLQSALALGIDNTAPVDPCNNVRLGTDNRTIWVAKGTYYPSTVNRLTPFMLRDSLKLYGGFNGDESLSFDLDHRDLYKNETILSGDFQNTPNDDTDDSYSVIKTVNVSSATIVDGVTIANGNADYQFGACFNRGGGWFNEGSGTGNVSNPTINRCKFINNKSLLMGGAFFSNSRNGGTTNPAFTGCQFIENNSQKGGAVAHDALTGGTAKPTFTNCSFTLNFSLNESAKSKGGAIYTIANNGTGDVKVTNCSFYGNYAKVYSVLQGEGQAIYSEGASGGNMTSNIINSIFYRNADRESLNFDSPIYNWDATTNISFSLVTTDDCMGLNEGFGTHSVNCGSGMLYTIDDPLFANTDDGDLRLQGNSPAIDEASNFPGIPETDALLRNRKIGVAVDMGAYEYISKSYVKADAIGKNNGSSWEDAFLYPSLATLESDTVWVAKGTYRPTYNNDREERIEIKNGQQFLGGFAGDEPSNYYTPFRDIEENETVISGNIGNPAESTDNSRQLIRTFNVENTTLISGFTLTDAYNKIFYLEGGAIRNETLIDQNNLTIFSNPKIEYCTFKNNYASRGGAYGSSQSESTGAFFYRCKFINNRGDYGGAVANARNSFSTPLSFDQCIFKDNQANYGGAIYSINRSKATFLNTKFYNNKAVYAGGAVFVGYIYNNRVSTNFYKSELEFSFCTIANNAVSGRSEFIGGAIAAFTHPSFSDSTFVSIDNSILWDNTSASIVENYKTNNAGNVLNISHSIVNEANCLAFESTDNIVNCGAGMQYNTNPQLLDISAGFFQLRCNSPAIDNADPTSTLVPDLSGNIKRGVLRDIGAYEYDSELFIQTDVLGGRNPQVSGIDKIIARKKVLNTNNSLFQAAAFISLEPGFEISPSNGGGESVFRAEIGGGCP